MSEASKSTLVITQNTTKQTSPTLDQRPPVQYKQVGLLGDFVGQLSDVEMQAEINRRRDEYLEMKTERKKEEMRIKKEEFGSSSSEENKSEEEQVESMSNEIRIVVKPPKVKIESKGSLPPNESSYEIVLQLKKLTLETELTFLAKQFEINKKLIPYSRISKISLAVSTSKWGYKLKIGIAKDDDIIMSVKSKHEGRDQSVEIFMRFIQIRQELNESKLISLKKKVSEQEFNPQMREEALLYDKIYKKSQIIGTWEQRYIVMKRDGLYSYRTLASKHTMYIPKKQVKQIQTRFDLYKEYLVVKLTYNILNATDMTDFGLPLDAKLIWVRHFANMIPEDP